MFRRASTSRFALIAYRKRRATHSTVIQFYRPVSTLVSLLRGLYGRVARKLRVHPSYVSRVARGERRSKRVENEIRLELRRIAQFVRNSHRERHPKKLR